MKPLDDFYNSGLFTENILENRTQRRRVLDELAGVIGCCIPSPSRLAIICFAELPPTVPTTSYKPSGWSSVNARFSQLQDAEPS